MAKASAAGFQGSASGQQGSSAASTGLSRRPAHATQGELIRDGCNVRSQHQISQAIPFRRPAQGLEMASQLVAAVGEDLIATTKSIERNVFMAL